MVIFLYNLYIFGIHPKLRSNEPCYKEVDVYFFTEKKKTKQKKTPSYLKLCLRA